MIHGRCEPHAISRAPRKEVEDIADIRGDARAVRPRPANGKDPFLGHFGGPYMQQRWTVPRITYGVELRVAKLFVKRPEAREVRGIPVVIFRLPVELLSTE